VANRFLLQQSGVLASASSIRTLDGQLRSVARSDRRRKNYKNMELHLPPDKQARLLRFAKRVGKDAAHVVEEAVDRMLDYEERFLAAVDDGRAASRRGALLEHDEVVARIERIFRS